MTTLTRSRRLAKAALVTTILAMGPTARADVPASGPGRIGAALAEFDALAREARGGGGGGGGGGLPRLSDPAAAAVLDRLFDAPAILGGAPYTAKDVPLLLDIFQRAIQVYKSYALFSATPSAQPDTARNGFLFQDEIVRSSAFCNATMAAAMTALGDFVAGLKPEQLTETRRKGLAQVRLGFTEMVSGFTLMLRSPDLRPDNQAILAISLGQNAAAQAKALPRRDRGALVAIVQAALPTLAPETRALIAPFVAAMTDASCEGLCALD